MDALEGREMEAEPSAGVGMRRHDVSMGWQGPERFLDLIEDPRYHLLLDLQSVLTSSTHQYWSSKRCRTIHLPVTTGAASSPMGLGSDSLPVEVELFGQRTFLADSMQFYLEYATRFSEEGSYYLMPSFRGEQEDATHLNQFYHSEVELRVDLAGAMDSAEDYIRCLSSSLLSECGNELDSLAIGVSHIQSFLDYDIPRIRFNECYERLRSFSDSFIENSGSWRGITRAGEHKLMELYGGPLWVTHWDELAVPFYQAIDPENSGVALNADLLLGIGETLGLGERHYDANAVLKSLDRHRVDAEQYIWYVEMKERFPMTTSGYGLGVERFLLWILGHDDIRDLQFVKT